MQLRKFIIENVRCFGARQELEIRPLTLLVGENSTGKTSILACLQALLGNYHSSPYSLEPVFSFNEPPYDMGAFIDIVRKTKAAGKTFVLGLSLENKNRNAIETLMTFCDEPKSSAPIIQKIEYLFPPAKAAKITLQAINNGKAKRGTEYIDIQAGAAGSNEFTVSLGNEMFSGLVGRSGHAALFRLLDYIRFKNEKGEPFSKTEEKLMQFIDDNFSLGKAGNRQSALLYRRWWYQKALPAYSIAPIRSEPKRTYNPLQAIPSPQGSEVPMLLIDLYRSDKERWRKLKKQLEHFGKTAGLFRKISVKTFAKAINTPFQLEFHIGETKANFIDVGYGLSQVLPILVQIFAKRSSARLLVQQPEVHLHPKGQAALASLFAQRIKNNGDAFIIETHSDYIIDRIGIEIRNKNIAPDDVSLVYLESAGSQVKAHNIKFDKQANLLDAPPSYRDFFNKEADELLGISQG